MALAIYWYDFICFAMVGGAILVSLWVIWQKEYSKICNKNSTYESLLITRSNHELLVDSIRPDYLSSTQLWTSCWRGIRPSWLLCSRAFSCIAMAGILSLDIRRDDPIVLVYYTEWTFTLVILYFALGTIISAHGCWMYSTKRVTENEEINGLLKKDLGDSKLASNTNFETNKPRETIMLQSENVLEARGQSAGFWGYLMQAVYQTCAGAVVLTDIVFWLIIVPFLTDEHFSLNLIMGCMHSLNAIFLLIDTALNNLPFPWFRLAYFVFWSCIYVVFQWILHACGFTWWPYPFLELSTPWAPMWYLGLAVIHIPCYGLYALIVKAKFAIYNRFFPHAIRESY